MRYNITPYQSWERVCEEVLNDAAFMLARNEITDLDLAVAIAMDEWIDEDWPRENWRGSDRVSEVFFRTTIAIEGVTMENFTMLLREHVAEAARKDERFSGYTGRLTDLSVSMEPSPQP